MARNYELTFIARPEMDPAGLTALIERVKGFITAEGGTIVKVDQWGMRRLSYPINKIRDGQYVYLFVQLEAQSVARIESRLKLVESVIRYLLVKSEDTNVVKASDEAAPEAATADSTPAAEAAPVASADAASTAATETSAAPEQAQPVAAAPVAE